MVPWEVAGVIGSFGRWGMVRTVVCFGMTISCLEGYRGVGWLGRLHDTQLIMHFYPNLSLVGVN